MAFELIPLPYKEDALEGAISSSTLFFHHDKHLAAYIANTNNLIKDTRFETMTLSEIVKESEGPLFNNAAQAWNHVFYFESFSAKRGLQPGGELLEKINKSWGSFEQFKTEFVKQGVAQFGSGWVWLVKDSDGNLQIIKYPNAENPLKTSGLVPLLTFDVWEHAYYLDFQNRRGDSLEALWDVVNWPKIEQRYSE